VKYPKVLYHPEGPPVNAGSGHLWMF